MGLDNDSLRARRSSQGIESRWGRSFPYPSTPAMGLAQPTVQWEPDIPGKETGEARRKPPTQSNAKVKEIVQLNFYSAPMPSRQVIG